MDHTRESHSHQPSQQAADSCNSCNASKDNGCWSFLESCVGLLEDFFSRLSRRLLPTRRFSGEFDSCLCLCHDGEGEEDEKIHEFDKLGHQLPPFISTYREVICISQEAPKREGL